MRGKSTSKSKSFQTARGFFFKRNAQRQQPFFQSSSEPKFFLGVSDTIHRKCDGCTKEEQLHRKANDGTATTPKATHTFLNKLDGHGHSLPKDQQQFFGRRMNYDFGEVKLHTGSEAIQSASNLGAQAFTYKNHIVFNEGKYNPSTTQGKKLLAHELVHIAQQSDTAKIYNKQQQAQPEWIPPDIGPDTTPMLRDRIMALVNGGDAAALNNSLRSLTPDQATNLLFDHSFIEELQGHFSGRALWSIFSIILMRAYYEPVMAELTSAILGGQAQLTTDLISVMQSSHALNMMHLRLLRIAIPQIFGGHRLLPQMMQLLNSTSVGGRISLDFQEAHYEANEQGQMEMQSLGSSSTPYFRVTSTQMRIVVRMNFIEPSGLPFFFSGGSRPGILAGWLNSIDQVWNNQFVLVNPTNRISLVFVPMVSTGGLAETIAIHTDNRDSCGFQPGRASGHCWFISDTGDTVAHEFGHLIGASDEYNLPATAREIPPAMQMSSEDTSLSTVEGIQQIQGRHGAPVAARPGGWNMPDSIMAGTSRQVHIQHFQRLLNAINATLPAGSRFIIQRTH